MPQISNFLVNQYILVTLLFDVFLTHFRPKLSPLTRACVDSGAGRSNLAFKLVQIGSKWDKSGIISITFRLTESDRKLMLHLSHLSQSGLIIVKL